ncbi:hypothetical protein DCS_02315 [Drechmeria coniospora]|uniref:Velvet domain-containing protein n=1 Tax=Drechmeria coniospora TaxID=98403 RepID=A0A151GVP7_DRECN|nr:hypothetical protein DCS_02315 [Drechmeria coniospora]KYK61174.1 hypothetical protein DCS_02315 [Drechmeria coniospora]ODA80939.1 hypothetical protein RJ55_03899 [Drechmeria coniospora]
MATSALIPTNPARDCVQRIHRITRENRSLWYQLTVLQQPERARACGSGMKANSDRRPVDPPPVVEMRIVEGPSVEEGKDITFDYNANFFLYASLEQARTIAHGRIQVPSASSNPPILTGVPAAGMAYLDRPAEAGYFIFPDLSVRHEGYFRLSFSLFETTKEEKDFDLEPSESDLPPGVDWRMEIKTQPFNVFSAKKFPGLMESTQLSKTVADQGCRVRIRRDVRMRKRDGKTGGYDRRDDDYAPRRTVTPAADDPHARSLSNAGVPRPSYAGDSSRRTSGVDPYAPPAPPSAYDQPSQPARGHLTFGEAQASVYAASRQCPHQPGLAAPTPSPCGPYASTPSHFSLHHSRALSSTAATSVCSSPSTSVKNELLDRSGAACVPPSPSAHSSVDGHSRRDSQPSYPATPMLPRGYHHPSLAPLKIASLVSPLPRIEAQTAPLTLPPVVPTGGKRKHELVFQQCAEPLHDGRRQQDFHYAGYRGMSDLGQAMYSRADGKVGVLQFSDWQQ